MRHALLYLAVLLITHLTARTIGFWPTAMVITAFAILYLTFKKPD